MTMTNEEAKKELSKLIFELGFEDNIDDRACALNMAIQALSQEPCDDIAQERYKDLCEYFGGAKDILKSREDFKAWLERVKWHIRKAEELYEKYEYKQEPMREFTEEESKAYSKALDKMYKPTGFNVFDEPCDEIDFVQPHKKIPVTLDLTPCDDAVSRILQRMWNCRGKHTTSIDKVAMEQIIRDELSSVTSKPVECDDMVSRGVFDQVRWERDIAIEQLHELGYELGQKIEPCDDVISRQAVIKRLKKEDKILYTPTGLNYLIRAIEELPSITQTREEREKGEYPYYAG